MPRTPSRPAQRARRAQKNTGSKYTALLREATAAPRRPRREPAHIEPARRLATRLRLDLGTDADNAARLVDDALAWALKAHDLSWILIKTPETDTSFSRARQAMREHSAGQVTVHDAPLVQAVHLVLEAAADQQGTPELLRACDVSARCPSGFSG